MAGSYALDLTPVFSFMTSESSMIYLDHNATTPVAPEVVEAMKPYLGGRYGNPSSSHGPGRLAKQALEEARGQVDLLLKKNDKLTAVPFQDGEETAEETERNE